MDLVVQLSERIRPLVAALSGSKLEQDPQHIITHRKWQSFRDQTMNALRSTYGADEVTSRRKSLKIAKGRV